MIRSTADGSFDYQMQIDSLHLLILYWRPDDAWINLMVKTSEGGWSFVNTWQAGQYRHPSEAIHLLKTRPRRLLARIRDRTDQTGPLEDHVNWVLDTNQAGAYRSRGVT